MALDKKTIKNISDLAKLNLSAEELTSFQKQLSKILAYVDKINKLKLEKVPESLSGVNIERSFWRADRVKIFKGKNLNQGKSSDDLLRVPKVFDK